MNKFINVAIVAALFSFTSCLEDQFSNLENSQKVTSIGDLKVASDFSWATSKTVSVQVLGLPMHTPVKSTLKISAGSNVYYTGFHSISDTLNLNVEVPATVQELTLSMGTIQRNAVIVVGKVAFSYVASVNN